MFRKRVNVIRIQRRNYSDRWLPERTPKGPRRAPWAEFNAAAIEHGFTRVTRNMPDCVNTGAQLLNPWPHTAAR